MFFCIHTYRSLWCTKHCVCPGRQKAHPGIICGSVGVLDGQESDGRWPPGPRRESQTYIAITQGESRTIADWPIGDIPPNSKHPIAARTVPQISMACPTPLDISQHGSPGVLPLSLSDRYLAFAQAASSQTQLGLHRAFICSNDPASPRKEVFMFSCETLTCKKAYTRLSFLAYMRFTALIACYSSFYGSASSRSKVIHIS